MPVRTTAGGFGYKCEALDLLGMKMFAFLLFRENTLIADFTNAVKTRSLVTCAYYIKHA